MNSFKVMLISLCAVWLVVLVSAAADPREDLANLAEQDGDGEMFDEDQVGYDRHADIFYYQDKSVNKEYGRKNYLSTKVTLAGQKPDSTLRAVRSAVFPFAVAQRTFKQFGTIMDRWDVKDTGKEAQFLALYHGNGNAYVVNKIRAHLLRDLANGVKDLLPSLDRLAEEDAQELNSERELVFDSVRNAIESVCRKVDSTVRRTMADSDDSTATATIAIITKSYVITVAVGGGRVIGYGEDFETTPLSENEDDPKLKNVFGGKKTRKEFIHPHIDFSSREDMGYQFLLLMTPSVTRNVDDEQATRIVTSEIDQHKYVKSEEQDIYSGSVMRILNLIESSVHPIIRFFLHSDYSLILVGLNTDYENIH